MTRRQTPQENWMPLREMAFQFGVGGDGTRGKATEEVWKELKEILRGFSGADAVEIDDYKLIFKYSIPDRGSESYIGYPWMWPTDFTRFELGLDPRQENICKAIRLVWSRDTLRALDRAIATGAIVLHAKQGSILSHFEPLPAEVWPLLDIIDWQHGGAIAPDNSRVWALHGEVRKETVEGKLAPASEASVAQAIHHVNEISDTTGAKRPNVNEMIAPVLAELARHGVKASKNFIQNVAKSKFPDARSKAGRPRRVQQSSQ